jgi:hypothetical protein
MLLSQSTLAYNESSDSCELPENVVPDEVILQWEATSLSDNDFLKDENDPALKETGRGKEVKF